MKTQSQLSLPHQLSLVLALLISTMALGQTISFKATPILPQSTPQRVEGGMWRLDAGFDSVLRLKNALLTRPIQATPSLVMSDGSIFALTPITLEPGGVAQVNINDAIRAQSGKSLMAHSMFGMVRVDYKWSWPGAIMASVHNVDETAMISFQNAVQSDLSSPEISEQQKKLQITEGAWWKPSEGTDLFLFLGNASNENKHIDVEILSSTGQVIGHNSLDLRPNTNNFVQPFTLLRSQPTSKDSGSLVIRSTGPDESLVAIAGLSDVSTGFSENIHLYGYHPERARNPSLHAITIASPGVMLGRPRADMLFPENTTFSPYLVAHNTSRAERHVDVAATFTQAGVPSTISLGSLDLRPGSTQIFDMSTLLSAGAVPDGNAVAITESFTGNDNDIYTQIGSMDQTNNYVFEAESHIEEPTISRTICYWTAFSDTNTMISLWNYKTEAQDVVLTLLYRGGGKYELPLHIEGLAGREIDIATLIKRQIADRNGNLLPSHITEGSALLASTKGDYDKLELAVASAYFNVRNATCGQNCLTCNGMTGFNVNPNPGSIDINGQLQYQGTAYYNTGGSQTTTSGSWSTSNTSISTVASGGMVSGVSTGDSTIFDTLGNQSVGTGYQCFGYNMSCPTQSFGGSAPGNVGPQPDNIVVLSDGTQTLNCSGGYTQLSRNVNYNVRSSSLQQVSQTIQVYETVDPNTTSTCTNTKVSTTATCTNISNGQISDTLNSGCPNYSNPGCGFTYPSQAWVACTNGSTKNLGTIGKDIVLSNSISLGGNTTAFPKGMTFPH